MDQIHSGRAKVRCKPSHPHGVGFLIVKEREILGDTNPLGRPFLFGSARKRVLRHFDFFAFRISDYSTSRCTVKRKFRDSSIFFAPLINNAKHRVITAQNRPRPPRPLECPGSPVLSFPKDRRRYRYRRRNRPFALSRHPVIPSSCYPVIPSSPHPPIRRLPPRSRLHDPSPLAPFPFTWKLDVEC